MTWTSKERRNRSAGLKRIATALLLFLCACEDGFLVIRTGVFAGGGPVNGYFTASINNYGWNSSESSGHYSGGIIIIIAWGYDQYDRRVDMRLAMRSTVGSAAQVIGSDDLVSAEITLHESGQLRTWTAGSGRGSGSFRLTALSADNAEGTFDFVATGTSTSTGPYRISRGSFRVNID